MLKDVPSIILTTPVILASMATNSAKVSASSNQTNKAIVVLLTRATELASDAVLVSTHLIPSAPEMKSTAAF